MFGSLVVACSLVAGLLGSPVPQAPAAGQKRLLRVALSEISRKTGVYAVAVQVLGGEPIPGPAIDEVDARNVEANLQAIVVKLPFACRLIKLYLPKGQSWSAEEILAYARAESTLLRRPIPEVKPEVLDILGKSLTPEKAQPAIDTLDLRPVYVIALKNSYFGGVWNTTYGEMRLEQRGNRVTGTYSTNSGVIEGVVVGDELRVTWYEQSNANGGTGFFKLSEDGMSFSGPWYNNSDLINHAGIWTGRRVGKATPPSGDPPPS